MKVAGLHLWKVSLRDASVNLWVTTRTKSAVLAVGKAYKVIKKLRKTEYPRASFSGIEYNGTIDA